MRGTVGALVAGAMVALAAACGGGSSGSTSAASSTAPTSSTPTATAAPTTSPAAGVETYTNPSPAFTISHPASWETNTQVSGAIVAFLAPTSSATDTFRENVNVLQQQIPAGMTLQKYTTISLAGVDKTISNFKTVSIGRTSVSGSPATAAEFTGSVGGKSLHWYAEWSVIGGSAWVLTYSAEPASYTRYLPAAKATMDSFRVG